MSSSRRAAAGLALAVLASLTSPVHALAAAGGGTSTGVAGLPCAQPLVADPVGGAAAVRELGADLPEAAANIGRSPADYRALLRSDSTLRVDECGQTFVIEPAMTTSQQSAAAVVEDAAAASAGEPTAAAGDASASADAGLGASVAAAGAGLDASGDAFALNSRPGSLRTIYLDFDGQQIVDTGWNDVHSDVTAKPYDTDGVPATFSPTERDAIRSVWLRVAEDYAPFDVNVTTQDPGPAAITRNNLADQQFGTRALITSDAVLWADICSCGGVAYVGVFDYPDPSDYYKPALVFQRGLGGTSASAKSIAEAAAHEVGHNLGLSHDGRTGPGATSYYAGQGAWAPIMGVSYYRPVSQWSNGDYAGANNAQDDLLVIPANGVNRVADDHANSATGATNLAYAGSAVTGLIGARTDTDWFAFTVPAGAGATTIQVSPQTVSADLDASLTVYDGAGAPVATADPSAAMTSSDQVTGLDATLTQTLAPGSYTARVDGVGSASPATTGYSDYASLGRYTISAGGPVPLTQTSTPPATRTPTSTPTSTPPGAPNGPSWRGTLRAAVHTLAVRRETPSGFSAARFPLVDAGCRSTRTQVLAAESRHHVHWTSPRQCAVRSGRWFSLFDRRSVAAASRMASVWTVPLAEAWRSGARSWPAARRTAYANDVADPRTLLAVSSRSARSRANREPQQWLPAPASRCSYVAEWVAVKLRWGLTVDRVEQARLARLATACDGTRLTVRRA